MSTKKGRRKNTRKCTTSTTAVPFTQLRKTFAKANKIWIKLCNFQVTCHLQPGKCHSKTISLRRALVFSLFFFFIHTLISLSLFIADIFSVAAKGLSPHSSTIRKLRWWHTFGMQVKITSLPLDIQMGTKKIVLVISLFGI